MMRRLTVVSGGAGVAGLAAMLCGGAVAQGTKLWTQSRYDQMERGTTQGVAIRNDGRLEVAPASSLLYATPGNYVWSIAADGAGDAFLGRGGTTAGSAIVTRVTPDGKGTDIFAGKELAVQALRSAGNGAVYAATSPDGKVYRIAAGAKAGDAAAATVVF